MAKMSFVYWLADVNRGLYVYMLPGNYLVNEHLAILMQTGKT